MAGAGAGEGAGVDPAAGGDFRGAVGPGGRVGALLLRYGVGYGEATDLQPAVRNRLRQCGFANQF